MVNFIPREIKDNVNVSKTSFLREFSVLFGSLIGLLVIVYIILGLALDMLIDRTPVRLENMLVQAIDFNDVEIVEKYKNVQARIQSLVDELVKFLPVEEQSRDYSVYVIENDDANALAFPGGRIVLFSALLSEVASENELVMILGHELGHFVHRDHLRGLGRGVVFLFISTFFLGQTHDVTSMLSSSLGAVQLKYSRQQESAADTFALKLLQRKYGHVAGATDFFYRMSAKEGIARYLGFMSSHPVSDNRIAAIDQKIEQFDYSRFELTPWDTSWE